MKITGFLPGGIVQPVVDSTTNSTGALGGDVIGGTGGGGGGGTPGGTTVVGLDGYPFSGSPSTNDLIQFNGSAWVFVAPPTTGLLSVTDGTTTVSPVTELDFTSGVKVTDGGGGIAEAQVTSIDTGTATVSSIDADYINVRSDPANHDSKILVQPHGVPTTGDTAIHLYYSRTSEGWATELFLGLGATYSGPYAGYQIVSGDANNSGNAKPVFVSMEDGGTRPWMKWNTDSTVQFYQQQLLTAISTPGMPPAGMLALYPKTVSGTVRLYYQRPDGTEIEVGSFAGSAAGGDLSGTYPSPGVAKVNGVAVTGTPSVGQVLTAMSSTSAIWQSSSSDTSDHEHIDSILFSGDGSTLAFELPAAPFDAYSVQAFVAGVLTDVTLSGALLTTATFGSAPTAGTNNIRFDIVAATA